MKVIQIINDYDPSSGGAERLVADLHLGLQAKGTDSVLLGICRTDLSLPKAFHLGLDNVYRPKAIWSIHKIIKDLKDKDTIIHAHLFPTIFYLAILKYIGLLKLELIYTEHSTSNRRRDKWWGKLIDRFVYKQIDRVITISDGTRDELSRWLPSLAQSCRTIYNGVKLRFDAHTERVLKGKPELLSIGRLTKAKNYDCILESLALLNHDFHFKIIGDGELRGQLKTKIDRLGLRDKVSLLGYVEDPLPALKEADVFLMVSSWEGFGMAAVEAMNASLPVVASDIAGLKEIFQEGGALLVDPNRPKEIAKAISQLIENEKLRHTLGQKGFEKSFEFSLDKMTDAYLSFYGEIE